MSIFLNFLNCIYVMPEKTPISYLFNNYSGIYIGMKQRAAIEKHVERKMMKI